MNRHCRVLLVLAAIAAALLSTGCKSDPGSQEFIPGKGWRPV